MAKRSTKAKKARTVEKDHKNVATTKSEEWSLKEATARLKDFLLTKNGDTTQGRANDLIAWGKTVLSGVDNVKPKTETKLAPAAKKAVSESKDSDWEKIDQREVTYGPDGGYDLYQLYEDEKEYDMMGAREADYLDWWDDRAGELVDDN